MIYLEPRPYILNSSIKALYDAQDVGNPACHIITGMVFFGLLLEGVTKKEMSNVSPGPNELSQEMKPEPRIEMPQFMKCTSLLSLVYYAWVFLSAYSRLYLGVNSLDQILLGIVIGLNLQLVYFYVLKFHLEKMLYIFIYRQFSQTRYYYQFLLAILLSYVFLVTMLTLAYNLNFKRLDNDEALEWKSRIEQN